MHKGFATPLLILIGLVILALGGIYAVEVSTHYWHPFASDANNSTREASPINSNYKLLFGYEEPIGSQIYTNGLYYIWTKG